MDADPNSAEIASAAQKKATEPGRPVAVRIYSLRALILFHFGRVHLECKCILFSSQTLMAPYLKEVALWPKTEEK